MACCRISSDIVRAQHQRMHPAAVPLCRVVKHAREWVATLVPRRVLRFGDMLSVFLSEKFAARSPDPAAQRLATPLSWRACRAQFVRVARFRESCHGPPCGTLRLLDPLLRHILHPRSWRMANQPGFASKVKGGSGTRRNVHQPRRKPTRRHGRDAGLVPEPSLFTRAYQRGHDCTTMLDMAGRALCTHNDQRQAAPGDYQ
jgi:hypothetical protein